MGYSPGKADMCCSPRAVVSLLWTPPLRSVISCGKVAGVKANLLFRSRLMHHYMDLLNNSPETIDIIMPLVRYIAHN